MTYTITSVNQVDETVMTTVEYDLNGTQMSIVVSHYNPTSLGDIDTGIKNRGISEITRLSNKNSVSNLVPNIVINQPVQF